MPTSGLIMLLCLIGLLTSVYFIGSFLDVVTDYFPNLYVIAGGRYQTCNDERIELSDDARAVCARALAIGPSDSSER